MSCQLHRVISGGEREIGKEGEGGREREKEREKEREREREGERESSTLHSRKLRPRFSCKL